MRGYQNFGNMGGRFNSEFGMEAYPHMSTIKDFISDENEMYSQSLTMDFHNKANDHERRLATYVLENFRISSLDFKVNFQTILCLQIETDCEIIVLGLLNAASSIRGDALCVPQLAPSMGAVW